MAHDARSLRQSSLEASQGYVSAQYRLLAACEAALNQGRPWPEAKVYEEVVELGRLAASARRRYLDFLGVPCGPRGPRADRVSLIQRLSAAERKWQPCPEDWLRAQHQDTGGARRAPKVAKKKPA